MTDGPRQAGQVCRNALDAQLETGSMASLATLTLVRSCLEMLLDAGDPADAEGLARRALSEQLCDSGTMRRAVVDLHCLLARAVAARRGKSAAATELNSFSSDLQAMLGPTHPWVSIVARTLQLLTP